MTEQERTQAMDGKQYAWWKQHEGMLQLDPPKEYENVAESDDWDAAMKLAGYEVLARLGDHEGIESAVGIRVWTMKWLGDQDHHLYVEFTDCERSWTHFFVGADDSAAFFLDQVPKLASMVASLALTDELRTIRKTMIAFVRHGAGETTISESGDETLDDRREFERAQRSREALKRTAEKNKHPQA